ncbi:MAG: hypothetical protein IJK89_06415 [Clostridia bacterium]|nr:hypothetical protein [Clostridia bacterium]
MKKAISVLMVLCLCGLAMAPCAAAQELEPLTLSGVPDVGRFILEPDPAGELHIAPATLETAEGAQEVWFVSLQGIDWLMRGANNFFSYLMVSFNISSSYFNFAKNGILQTVPEGSKLVLAGHSLGGMIVQQLICADEITSRYEVINALTLGSPYVMVDAGKREGRLVRLEDRYDTIPRFSIAFLLAPSEYNGAVKRGSPYFGNANGAHNHSYRNGDVWGAFDALGAENGSAKLLLDRDAMTSLRA